MNYDDRIKALAEIKRVLKESGIFIFSTHNLYNLKQLYSLKICKNPIFYAKRVLKFFKLVVNNGIPAKFRNADWAIINDGYRIENFCYYTKPAFQITQLQDLGFKDINLYALDGKQIESSEDYRIDDPWIYYFCIKG